MTRKTQLVAIVNVTPDSFSDGGAHFMPNAALSAVARAIAEGADVIDIGAESTRPGASPLSYAQEWARLAPVLEGLAPLRHGAVRFSLDTRHGETAAKALPYGIDWINDVSGFASGDMVKAVQNASCKLVVMHSLSIPADKNQVLADDADVIGILLEFAHARIEGLRGRGIARERIIFDPGIGFGKTAAQSRLILDSLERFDLLGVKLMIGHSRKSFLGVTPELRDAATLDVSRQLIGRVDYLRVHDIASHRALLGTPQRVSHG